MRALVTGSTGCVGANLCEALIAEQIDVTGLRRSTSPDDATTDLDLNFVTGDIMQPDSLRPAMDGVDWVFHVAAISDYWHTDPDLIYRVNVEGTRNVMQAALEAGVKRFVLTSSVAALGFPPDNATVLDESARFNIAPEDFPYGYSKQLAEDMMAEYVQKGLDAVSVLPAAVLGPRDLKYVGGEIIIQALRGVPAMPRGGLNYIDARDVAQGHIGAARYGDTGKRYILAGHNLTHHDLLAEISAVLGTKAPKAVIPDWALPPVAWGVGVLTGLGLDLPIDRSRVLASNKFMYYANDRAKKQLDLTVRPLADSIRDAAIWYRDHGYFEPRGVKPPAL